MEICWKLCDEGAVDSDIVHFGSNNWLDANDTVIGVGEVQGAARKWTNGVDCDDVINPVEDCCDPLFIDTHNFIVTVETTGDTTGVPVPSGTVTLTPSETELVSSGTYAPLGGGDDATINFFWRPDEEDNYCVSGDLTGFLLVNVSTVDCDNCTWVFEFDSGSAHITLTVTVAP